MVSKVLELNPELSVEEILSLSDEELKTLLGIECPNIEENKSEYDKTDKENDKPEYNETETEVEELPDNNKSGNHDHEKDDNENSE